MYKLMEFCTEVLMGKSRALLTEGEGCDGEPLTMEYMLWRVFLTVQNQFWVFHSFALFPWANQMRPS